MEKKIKILPFKLFESPDDPSTYCEQKGVHFNISYYGDYDAFPFGYVKTDDIKKLDPEDLDDLDSQLEDLKNEMTELENKRDKKTEQIEEFRNNFISKYSPEVYEKLPEDEKYKLEVEESKLLDEYANIRKEIRNLNCEIDEIDRSRIDFMDKISQYLENFNVEDADDFWEKVNKLPEYKGTKDIKDGYKMMCGSKRTTHYDLGTSRSNQYNNGRIWSDSKYITFWDYPKDYEDLMKTLQDIDKSLQICQNDNRNIYDNRKKWFIELVDGEVIPLTQYKGGEQRSAEELAKLHFDPKAREVEVKRKLDAGEELVKKGWGSKSPKNKREWRKALGESIMTFEDYSHMNYPDLYDEPVADYVDTDYYNTNVIEEDPEDDALENPGLNKRSVGIRRKPKSKFSAE